MVAAAHLAHLAVEETVFEPLASAYACVHSEARARGVAVLDMGIQSSDLVIYDGDAMLLAASVPVWGDHLTRDIAAIFKVTYEDAECLKQEYGCALLGLTADSSLIEVPSLEGRPPREARRSELNEILEARAEELFLYVRAELQRVGMERHLSEGVVLTGGGALLTGMCDMAERVLDCQAANGIVTEDDIGGWPEELKSPLWTTAAGLAMYSAKLNMQRTPSRHASGLMGLVMK
jgi:cell division protein FtsA